jgi:hypothetical protein
MGLVDMYNKDIRAIPADKWTATFGGASRSAMEATADVIGLLNWTTEALKGNVESDIQSYISEDVRAACAEQEGACGALSAAAGAFAGALGSASDEALNSLVTPPWKMDAPLFILCHIAVSHVWYHDGQLNYIQSLLGDGEVHWMD